MRFLLFFCLAALPSCLDGGEELEKPKAKAEGESSTIVFGITERTDPASGKTVTTAGHEYLSADSSTSAGWAANRQSWPDGWCRRFATSGEHARREPPSEGRAHFAGGRLGTKQIVLDAKGADPKFDGAAFEPQRPMMFDIESGFGIPKFEPVEVPAPNTSLVVRSARDRGVLAIESGEDVRVEWSPRENADASVMIAFDTDDRVEHVRCFIREREAALVVRAEHLAGMRAGTLTIASHRTASVKPGTGSLVEIVATVVASEQRFVVK